MITSGSQLVFYRNTKMKIEMLNKIILGNIAGMKIGETGDPMINLKTPDIAHIT